MLLGRYAQPKIYYLSELNSEFNQRPHYPFISLRFRIEVWNYYLLTARSIALALNATVHNQNENSYRFRLWLFTFRYAHCSARAAVLLVRIKRQFRVLQNSFINFCKSAPASAHSRYITNLILNSVNTPSSLVTVISPSCASMICFDKYKPKPVPIFLYFLDVEKYLLNTNPMSLGLIPLP